jgi:hypothetical protein
VRRPYDERVTIKPAKRPLIVWDVVVTSILLVLLALLSFFVSVFGAFLAMASDPCGAVECDTGLIGLGVLAAMILPWVVLIATVVGAVILIVVRRLSFWVPLVGTPLVIASWFVGAAIASAGVPTG